jgi:pimeloyl-ACP methyl ester carboxylesterase
MVSAEVRMLEIIDKGATTAAHPTPLLFVHGGYHAAWCWDDHFLDHFADRGFRAVAVSFRAHGASGTDKPLPKLSIADYVDDVREAAERLGGAPVLVAHSMGGWTVQHYLERYDAPAAVLMASIPPQGILRCALRTWVRHPVLSMRANISGRNYELFTRRPREALHSRGTPQAVVDATAARCGLESMRAAFVDASFRRPRPTMVTTPMLVLGGTDDGTITVAEVRATAAAYGTDAVFFPQTGHNMMLEPAWRDVAERIEGWLGERGL